MRLLTRPDWIDRRVKRGMEESMGYREEGNPLSLSS